MARSNGMHGAYYTEIARQWVAEQGAEADAHLADAIRALRAVGDEKGAKLLMRIARQVDLINGDAPRPGLRQPIRRRRDDVFDPSA